MGMDVGGKEGGPRSDINVTPLVDVCLVLLIIFMVVTPMLQRSKEVDLPTSSHTDDRNKEEDPLTVAITSDERIWLGNEPLPLEKVKEIVKASVRDHPQRSILLKGDKKLKVKQMRKVMHEVQEAGAKLVGLGVEQPEQ